MNDLTQVGSVFSVRGCLGSDLFDCAHQAIGGKLPYARRFQYVPLHQNRYTSAKVACSKRDARRILANHWAKGSGNSTGRADGSFVIVRRADGLAGNALGAGRVFSSSPFAYTCKAPVIGFWGLGPQRIVARVEQKPSARKGKDHVSE